MNGSNRNHYGLEFGIESQLTSTIKATSAVAYGEYVYSNYPNLYLTSDDINGVANYGSTYIKNYKVPGTPQRAYSIGLEHRDPKYWWISANANYLTNNYMFLFQKQYFRQLEVTKLHDFYGKNLLYHIRIFYTFLDHLALLFHLCSYPLIFQFR